METSGTAMTLVYDDGVFTPQGPVPAIKNHTVVRVVIVDDADTAVGDATADDGWTMMKRLQGCITETPPGAPIGREHDKYLYGR